MWLPNGTETNMERKGGRNGLVAVAIDKDKNSQHALKWAIENLLVKGQALILIHVLHRSSAASLYNSNYAVCDVNGGPCVLQEGALDNQTKELFLTFHCFCTRKDIHCYDVILEDTDVATGITEYVAHAAIENLVLGASRHGFIKRLKTVDIPTSASKGSPDFCTVYVISKSKISSVRNACRLAPFTSPLKNKIQQLLDEANNNPTSPSPRHKNSPNIRGPRGAKRMPRTPIVDYSDHVKSPFVKGIGYNAKIFGDHAESDTDISFVSSDRPSTDGPSMLFDSIEFGRTSQVSSSSESSFGMKGSEFSSFTTDISCSSVDNDDVEAEMRRLKLELQRTMEMYSTACKEALNAKQTAVELHRWRIDEERRLEEARLAGEAEREQEKAKYKTAIENSQAAERISEMESEKRVNSEMKSMQESDKKHEMSTLPLRYRRYSIEDIEEATQYFAESRKIGEGGYGPVYKCYLDNTPVAIKVLRPDAAQGRLQFQKEVEVLTCMRHPNLVLLLGACPEYGCLVYEYMSNGSLDDRLFRRGKIPALSWQLRFQIAAEIATGLHFLHMTKPEPLVHRDLKPGNILLDQNYVSKIGDVGLARLVPPSVANDVTQYRMTSTAGTFCYIDPEYQQTGMLGVKSDVYSLGIVLLQILTAKPAMGLTHYVNRAIEHGTLEELLDPAVPDWPVEEALKFAKLALKCAELRRKDRPDLGKNVLPELNRLREVSEEKWNHYLVTGSAAPSPNHSFASSANEEVKSEPNIETGQSYSREWPRNY